MLWSRTAPLAATTEAEGMETWLREEGDETLAFRISVLYGKKTDLLKLKSNVVSSLKDTIAYHQKSRGALYAGDAMEEVGECPVCRTPSSSAVERVVIHGASYVQCAGCSHVYVKRRPTSEAIGQFYLSDTNYAATYVDKSAAEHRLQTIAVPWREWVRKVYSGHFGREPESILDVGSGAGHFVEACRRVGMRSQGNEISEVSREFARNVWGIDMDGRDFREVARETACDVVTFWGMLEHTPDPAAFLNAARPVVGPNGMVIAKLPRWDSLSTAAQIGSPNTVIRHLDPMGHIMCFTDASAAELFHRCGFKPVAAWYYGMDVYELISQACVAGDEFAPFTASGGLQMAAQAFCDNMRASDGLVVAAVPVNA